MAASLVHSVSEQQLRLIQKLAEKAKQGKITWKSTDTGLTASLGDMELAFVKTASAIPGVIASLLGFGPGWRLFTIRDTSGVELLRVERYESTIPTGGTTPEANPLLADPRIAAVTELFTAALRDDERQLQKAIDFVDKI